MKDMQFRRLLAKKFHEHVSDAYCLLYLHLEIGGYFSQYANELSSDEYGDYSVFTPTERSDFLNESGLMSSFRKIEEGGFKEINKYFETANLLSVFVLMDEFLHENSRKSHETIDIIYDDIRHTVHLLQSDISHNDFITTRKQRDNPIRVMHWNHILTNSFSFAFDFKALPESAWTNFHSKNRETPKICVCSFESAGVEFEIDRGETDVSFLAKDIHPSVDRFAEAEKVLHYAVENDCDIVIFPELTIPNNIVDEIACWLNTNRNRENSKGHGISLVIAGSFHKYNRKKDAYFNTCTALDHTGSIAFTHDKMTRFTGDEKYGVEKTSTGRSLAIIELPFGRGVTLICKDFCDDNMRMHDFAHQSGVDYFFVPTMGGESTMKLHETRVKAIYRMAGPVVALVNQELGDPTDNGASSIYHGFLRGEIGKKSTISRLGYESFGKDVT